MSNVILGMVELLKLQPPGPPVDPAKKDDAPALAAKKDAAKDTTTRDTPPEEVAKEDAPSKGEPEPEAKPDDTPPSKPAADTPVPDGPFAVVDLGVGTNVADRELEGRSERFSSDSGTLYAWVKIKNDADPRPISMVWFHEDKEKFRYALDIGKSPSWRTWTKKTIVPKTDMGLWSVRIESADGNVLREVEFSVR